MDSRKRRSSLRKPIAFDVGATDVKTQFKRRISFSGKHLVREFHGEEEPKTWNNSYEISDHLNVDESTLNHFPFTNSKKVKSHENKENVKSTNLETMDEMKSWRLTKTQRDISSTNNTSVFSTSKDMINVSYQNSKLYQIENSVDITLHERELKFRIERGKDERSATNICSFSLDDNEKGGHSTVFCERTVDFMRDLQNNNPSVSGYDENIILEDIKNAGVPSSADNMNEESCMEFTCPRVDNAKEVVTIHANDSLIMSPKTKYSPENQKMNNKIETTRQTIVKLISPHKTIQYDKENINPFTIPSVNDTMLNANGTINNICEMEVEDSQFFNHQSNVNVGKESREFGNKLNCISFLQDPDSDAYIKEGANRQKPIINANVKYRPTINFNQPIEISPKSNDFNKNKIKSCTSIHTSTQSMNLSQENIFEHKDISSDNLKSNPINVLCDNEYENSEAIVNPLQKRKLRHTINFNRSILVEDLNDENKNDTISQQEVSSVDNLKSTKTIVFNNSIVESSPINEYKNCEGIALKNKEARHIVNFNQSMIGEALSRENKRGAISRTKIRLPRNNSQSIEISPINTRADFPRQTIKCYEDIQLSSQKPSKECVTDNKLITSESSLNNVQQPKLVVRKIYTPLINTNTNPIDVEQHKIMRYKMKQKEKPIHKISMNKKADAVETPLVEEQSVNFSMSSLKNMSLSTDSSSFFIPSEFKGYNLKQLNDEIENGKLHVFSNAIKTPGSNRKLRTPSHFGLENIQSFQTYAKHRRTLVFQNEDILVTSNDSLNKVVLNEASKEKKNNAVCRYSQADDIMLDNTSFLAKAKLSDETVSRNSSRKEVTQLSDFLDISNESFEKAVIESNLELNKNTGNQAVCSMFRNDKPIFIQAKDSNINEENTSTYMKSYKNHSMDKSAHAYDNLIQNKSENNDNKMVSDDLNCQNILDDNYNINDEKMVTVNGSDSSANVAMIEDRNRGVVSNIIEKLKGNKSLKNFVNNETDKSLLDICESNFIELSDADVKERKIRRRENETHEQKRGGRKSINVEENMNLTLDNIETEKDDDKNKIIKCEGDYIKTEQISSQGANIQNLKNTIQTRDSIDTTECMDFTLDEYRQKGYLKKVEKELNSVTKSYFQSEKSVRVKNCEIDIILDELPTTEENISADDCDNSNLSNVSNEFSFSNNKTKGKSMLFNKNNDMTIDRSISQVDYVQFPEPIMQLNAAKVSLERNITTTSMASKLQGILNKQNNSLVTPVKTSTFNQLCYITPRLSLIEFTAAEKRAKKEQILQNSRRFSPTLSEISNKRMPVDLTPLLSISKKRQTLIFDDCLMDESHHNGGVNVVNGEKEQNQETLSLSEHELKGPVMEISGICSNESLLQTPPKQRHSQIPIHVNSEQKSLRYILQLNKSSDNFTEPEKESDLEDENFAESIQLMRKMKSSKQIVDPSIECVNNIAIQASVFEGNPITISDVSIFFEAQRKSQSLAPKIKEGLTTEEHNVNGVNAIEAAKNGLENRYINLTLDDIDKTHLSLVRASYEDEDSNQSISKFFVVNDQNPMNLLNANQDVENNKSFNTKRRSVCRKCKRCEETFLNESTSSTSDTFVLPELPSLPDLKLDLLKRLRKRPTTSDFNILWQRLSLDGKIMNTINISDNSVVISDMEDEKGPITTHEIVIENYRLKRERLNNRLSEECFKKPPFVERLNNLLRYKKINTFHNYSINLMVYFFRTPSSNWIFDFQKQYRGILSFTHRHMLTFSVLLTFEEVDALGCDIKLKDVQVNEGHMPETCWKPIDFVLNFQFKLNLPLDLKSLCECNSEAGILNMLQKIDRFCVDTIKMGISLQRICFTNQASILRDEHRTYVCKTVRKIVNRNDPTLIQSIDKTVIKIELLNLRKLSFKDICSPKLHNFREEIHLLPVGLEFLSAFLPNPLKYLKNP
ncbi:hypothetical protein DOY81_004889 [Sarcophaga bullata]|nr:hypothetical protein DOY81_004889 [Sarcophaga bullata]